MKLSSNPIINPSCHAFFFVIFPYLNPNMEYIIMLLSKLIKCKSPLSIPNISKNDNINAINIWRIIKITIDLP